MLKSVIIALTGVFLLTSSHSANYSTEEGIRIIRDVLAKNTEIEGLRMTMLLIERTGNDLRKKKDDFKIRYNPLSIYFKQEYPNRGLEVLYNRGMNDDRALVNPNGFPWMSINLDPLGNTMRKGQHHSVFKSGFNFFLSVLEHLYEKYKLQTQDMVEYDGMVKYGDILCYKVVFNNPDFKYITYKVQHGENLETLSRKLFVCDYMIYEMNPRLSSFEDLKPGMTLTVPNDYGKQFVLYIDKQKMVPAGVKVYDDKGLFEEYSFLNVVINPVFDPKEFSENFPAYDFD